MFNPKRARVTPILFFCLIMLVFIRHAIASNIEVKLPKSQVKWGRPFTIEIEAQNPEDITLQGGITASFSSNVIVKYKNHRGSNDDGIYYEGEKVFYRHNKGHKCCVPIRDIMVENWYRRWGAREKRKMRLELFAFKTGLMKIYSRAAFIIDKDDVKNIPKKSSVKDQQNYRVNVSYIMIQESEDFLNNIRLLLNNRGYADSDEFIMNLQQLINDPYDKDALAYFGIKNVENSPQYLIKLKSVLSKRGIWDSPNFVPNLKALVNDLCNARAREFFDLPECEGEKESLTSTSSEDSKRKAQDFINMQTLGMALSDLITAEEDIDLLAKPNTEKIELRYRGLRYTFYKTSDIVLKIAQTIVRIKPNSKFINEPTEFSRYSYYDLIKALSKR